MSEVQSDKDAAIDLQHDYNAGMVRGDQEDAHQYADNFLCALLESLGYTETVKVFRSLDKWYS